MKPRRRLPASTATSMKYGSELREMRSVPSRSAATDSRAEDVVPLHSVIGGKLRRDFAVAIFRYVVTAVTESCCCCREREKRKMGNVGF